MRFIIAALLWFVVGAAHAQGPQRLDIGAWLQGQPAATALNSGDILFTYQGGVDKQVSVSTLAATILSGSIPQTICITVCTTTPGARGPLLIVNNIAGNNAAGQNAGLQVWVGDGTNLLGTPDANNPIAATFYIDNLNNRGGIWATNTVCIQQPLSVSTATSGIVHCNEANVVQSIAPTSVLSAYSTGSTVKAWEAVCNQNTSASPQPCQAAYWTWSAGDYANNSSSQFQPFLFGLSTARVEQAGMDCEINPGGASDTGTYFKQGCVWDQSNSATSYQVTGTHTSVIDVSGSTHTQFANCAPAVCNFQGTVSVTGGWLLADYNASAVYPTVGPGMALGWNFAGGQAEGAFMNTYTSGATISFQWRQKTGVSTSTVLATMLPSGDFTVAGPLGVPLTTWTDTQTCTAGQIISDANFIYVCTATNTVKRAALSTF